MLYLALKGKENWCKYCCRRDNYSPCEPFEINGELIDLDDGMPCVRGFCHKGFCEKQVQDLVERFWDIIENISPSDLGLKANHTFESHV